MTTLTFSDGESFGRVVAVDTATVRISVQDIDQLRTLQVNRLVVLQSSRPGQHLIGLVQKIIRKGFRDTITQALDEMESEPEELVIEDNSVRVALVGTLIGRKGVEKNIFRRTLESVPEIDAACFKLEGQHLTTFMQVLSHSKDAGVTPLSLGNYTLDDNAEAFVDGNRFFQRHAVVVGSSGSGKSWTTARLLEQISVLPSANSVLFDLHGEYAPITGDGIQHLRIAGPGDLDNSREENENVIFLPYWLLSYELLVSMLVDHSDQNAPNQTMVVARTINDLKRKYLEDGNHEDVLMDFTLDSPVPFSLEDLVSELTELDIQMVPGSGAKPKQGPFYGKLTRLIARIENRRSDRRIGFMFSPAEETNEFDWLGKNLCSRLMNSTSSGPGGVKIIDCSSVPSDIIPLVLATLSRLVFTVQQWTPKSGRHPIALICEEAHLYIPAHTEADAGGAAAASVFSRIAKERRKYGVSLVVISQRPSEVSRTVLSQCSNFVALRLTNAEDQSVIQRLLPDSLGGFAGLLPILDTGEAIVVGDACLLPSRIRISEPENKPASGTVDFWDEWARESVESVIEKAVHSMRCQN